MVIVLWEVKKEQSEEGERRRAALKGEVDAEVRKAKRLLYKNDPAYREFIAQKVTEKKGEEYKKQGELLATAMGASFERTIASTSRDGRSSAEDSPRTPPPRGRARSPPLPPSRAENPPLPHRQ